jgi:integrase
MEIKAKIFKRKSGKSAGKWIVRLSYYDDIAGKQCTKERHADKRGSAIDLRDRLVNELNKSHGQSATGERMTFDKLADICAAKFYGPAKFAEGRRISGVRSHQSAKFLLKNLRSFFGKRLIKNITAKSLEDYKVMRLGTNSQALKRPVKIATTNRELGVMSKIMRHAFGEGWIPKDIFYRAGVIDKTAATERSRLLTRSEETRLLASCQGERTITYQRTIRGEAANVTTTISTDNTHLRVMIILALDSGMRRGEILKLRWNDIDLGNNTIRILASNTKSETERFAPLSERAKAELIGLREIVTGERPFPYTHINRSFATAKRFAGIEDLHFHDLRRTAITRWLQQGTPLAFVAKMVGHRSTATTMKFYTAVDDAMLRATSGRIDSFNMSVDNEDFAFVN